MRSRRCKLRLVRHQTFQIEPEDSLNLARVENDASIVDEYPNVKTDEIINKVLELGEAVLDGL